MVSHITRFARWGKGSDCKTPRDSTSELPCNPPSGNNPKGRAVPWLNRLASAAIPMVLFPSIRRRHKRCFSCVVSMFGVLTVSNIPFRKEAA